jgi:threonine dehydrogenase-like Zn-dependent dehydrogenase
VRTVGVEHDRLVHHPVFPFGADVVDDQRDRGLILLGVSRAGLNGDVSHLLRLAGARHVVITDVNPYRLSLAERAGVAIAVNTQNEQLRDVQKRLAMKEGFDVGLEISGAPVAFREMLENMSHGGRIAMLGIPSTEIAIDWNSRVSCRT